MTQKRPFSEDKRRFKKNKKQKASAAGDGSHEEVLLADVRRLLRDTNVADGQAESDKNTTPDHHAEVELVISELSSSGDGLATKDGQVYVVPFCAPGDTILARVQKPVESGSYSLADSVKVLSPSPLRTETPVCPYFARCSGCQFQHLSYPFQLAHKKAVVEKAYRNFSNLPASAVPPVDDTVGSPTQYGYRTKLTPHFDGPPGSFRAKKRGMKVTWDKVPPIGFMEKNTRKTIDIEDCPIGTDAVRSGMKRERSRVTAEIQQYQRGATLLLRESTERVKKPDSNGTAENGAESDPDVVMEERGEHVHRKTCITDQKATSTEYVEDFRFDNPAGSFFQNNNSILPLITNYIRDHILGTTTKNTTTNGNTESSPSPGIKNLVDAYCGSGFFSITLSPLFQRTIGIDISAQSIAFAAQNAKLNNLSSSSSTTFIAADANRLFDSLDASTYPAAETAVVIDPPRKGCDENFIRQLLAYAPERICYVSCNVHTQARDVGWLVQGVGHGGDGVPAAEGMYVIESLRGFDFFPQTSHVEGVAILRKKAPGGDGEVAG